MEFAKYETIVKSIVIQELTQSGWVELIRVPIEHPEKATPQDIQDVIEAVHKIFYSAEKLELSIQGMQLCILNLDKAGKTFRICASHNAPLDPVTVE